MADRSPYLDYLSVVLVITIMFQKYFTIILVTSVSLAAVARLIEVFFLQNRSYDTPDYKHSKPAKKVNKDTL